MSPASLGRSSKLQFPPANCDISTRHQVTTNNGTSNGELDTLIHLLYHDAVASNQFVRINFKIATLAYQSLTLGQPTYLSAILTPHQPQRSLRSVNQNLLSVPRCNSSFGQISFPTVPLKSGMTYHFRSDSPLHSTALSAT